MDAQAEKKITIDQVAKLCGVSKTTISRYLNGKFENISAETRENIRQVIEELDYRPNRSAQRLKASRSMLIGCTIGDVSSPFSGLLLKGITRVCEAAGYQVLFADSAEDPKRERNAIQGFLQNQVDGLIVNSPGGNDMLLIETQERGVPIVLADRGLMQEDRLDTVASTDRQSAFDEWLIWSSLSIAICRNDRASVEISSLSTIPLSYALTRLAATELGLSLSKMKLRKNSSLPP